MARIVDSRIHSKDQWFMNFYKDGKCFYKKQDGINACVYCGSMSPEDALKLLNDPMCHASGADWKYGWPHKFYIRVGRKGIKFYSKHLFDAKPETFSELSEILAKKLGIRFFIDGDDLKYISPYHGFQTWFGTNFDDQSPAIPSWVANWGSE